MARPRIGVAALARATFDVPFAEETAARAFALLDRLDVEIVGSRELLFDAEATQAAIDQFKEEALDVILVLQVTFTDASMTVALANSLDVPVVLWAFPEARNGGRLRLNSFCGINLAGHAMSKASVSYGYVYLDPDDNEAEATFANIAVTGTSTPTEDPADSDIEITAIDDRKAIKAFDRLAEGRIAVIGEHPVGFDTCAYDPRRLQTLTGTEIDAVPLNSLFESAKAVTNEELAPVEARVEGELSGLDDVEAEPLDKSLRIYTALRKFADESRYDAIAVRCWPEFFTDYGCAACGAMAMMGQDGTPCACEADAYGSVTNLMMTALVDEPVFIADLVDISLADNTGVFWHCGLAPISMADPDDTPTATVHSNRRKPLLGEFALKPGRVTIARLSQSSGRTRMVIGGAEMIAAPKSYSGTSGVARFDSGAQTVLDTVMGEGLEHHYTLAYGDHRGALAAFASRLSLSVVTL
ncbi:MAG: L-fucose/L-arabinose isomerase family protein [Pseudomonadota bacterium]